MKISIIGTGYVGLTTGATFAELGHHVVCVDNNTEKIASLKSGKIPIYEPGLEQLVLTNCNEGRLSFSTEISDGVEHGEVIFVAVATPPRPDGSADLSAIENVSVQIGKCMTDYRLIVEKSTVPVNTGNRMMKILSEAVRPGIEFDVASNPEFLREGSALTDAFHPDRVVIGVTSDRARSILVSLYEPLNAPILITDINSAELIKHTSNAFLAMKISFINAVALICEKTGADIIKVAKGAGLDKRIGELFLNAGIGFGGSCFPKDVAAFIHLAEKAGYDFRLLREVAAINSRQKLIVVHKLKRLLGNLSGKTITILGLAFKPNTDDIRSSPALDIIPALRQEGAQIRAHDPKALHNMKQLLPDIDYRADPYEAVTGADAVAILTEWPDYKNLDILQVKKLMAKPVLVDGRNLFSPQRLRQIGFAYDGVGRGNPLSEEHI